jgi:hypothetical protein
MADISGFLFPTEEPTMANIGVICVVSWAIYLAGIMLRRIWHRHQQHIDRTVMAVVRREICKEYEIMLQRIHTFHRESLGGSNDGNLIEPNKGIDNDKEYISMLKYNGSSNMWSTPNTPRADENRNTTPQQSFNTNPIQSMNRLSISSCDNILKTNTNPIQSMNRLSISSCDNVFKTTCHTKIQKPIINTDTGARIWNTLHRDVNAFVEFEQLVLLTDGERIDILRRSMVALKQRIWFLGRDPDRRIHTCWV